MRGSVSLTASEARKFARERRRKVNRGLLGNLPGLVGSQDGECCVCMDAQADGRIIHPLLWHARDLKSFLTRVLAYACVTGEQSAWCRARMLPCATSVLST